MTPCLAARADTFTQSVQFGPGQAEFLYATGTTTAGGNGFNFFDTSAGALDAIVFSLSYTVSSSITIKNTYSGSSGTGTVQTDSGAQFGSTDSGITAALNRAVNTDGSAAYGASLISPVAFDAVGSAISFAVPANGTAIYYSTTSDSRTVVDTSALDLLAFGRAGGGAFLPLLSTTTGLFTTVYSGNVLAAGSPTVQGMLTVTYDYTPEAGVAVTPEPSSLALLGTGAITVLAATRRRLLAR